ncbi:MAG: DUF1648 domain-containing protein [Alicyclobacillaceae bacterium]|nr:DUF1648 domain-containing protein [Alicyclobacillaceae bacterium]
MKRFNWFRLVWIVPVGLAAWSWVFSAQNVDRMPDPMIIHWSFDGRPNGWATPFWGLFGPSLLGSALTVLLILLAEFHDRGAITFNTDPLNPRLGKWLVWGTSLLIWGIFLLV